MQRIFPWATWLILILTAVVYAHGNPSQLLLWPIGSEQFRWWQPMTYALTHGNVLHLIVNLLALLSFGPALERVWRPPLFITCYLLAAVLGGVVQASVSDVPVAGASAALFGLFAAYAWANPHRKILSVIPFALPAWKVLVLYVALSLVAAALNWLSSVAHLAHLGGVFVGALFAVLCNDKAPR